MRKSMSLSSLNIINPNITHNHDDYDIEVNKEITTNDVIAIKTDEYSFKVGKVNEIKEQKICISFFHNKLDGKSQNVNKEDVLINFSNI
ncbi:unnamed protein product, partial [Rotaria sordida]